MISDDDLYTLAVFLGSLSMLLIVLYHFLEVNAKDAGDGIPSSEKLAGTISPPSSPSHGRSGSKAGSKR
ncbi:MAG: hypothetical protein M4579_001138 [Chaenotheca gracillima]|nr:MAG: hypothetical protein M4579_001138 [Chaenotheca gracillima]